jgi:hypothetical protein
MTPRSLLLLTGWAHTHSDAMAKNRQPLSYRQSTAVQQRPPEVMAMGFTAR